MYIIYILRIQDGDNRYYINIPKEIPDNSTQSKINSIGEKILEEEMGGQREDDNVWDSYMSKLGRYYSYKIVPNKEIFKFVQELLNY